MPKTQKNLKTEKFSNVLRNANVSNIQQGDKCKCGKCLSQQNSNNLRISQQKIESCICLSKKSKKQKFALVGKNHFFRNFSASVRKHVLRIFWQGLAKITFCDFWSNMCPKITMRRFLQGLSKITVCELFARVSKIHFLRFLNGHAKLTKEID